MTGAPLRTPTRAGGGRTLPRAPGWSPFAAERLVITPVISALLVIVALLAVYLAFIRPREAPVIVPVVAPQATPATPAVEANLRLGPLLGLLPRRFLLAEGAAAAGRATFEWEIDGPASTGTGLSSQVAMSPDAHLWVLDGAHGLFQIYDKDGVLLDSWGEAGSGQGQFDFQRDNGEVVGNVSFTPLHADEPSTWLTRRMHASRFLMPTASSSAPGVDTAPETGSFSSPSTSGSVSTVASTSSTINGMMCRFSIPKAHSFTNSADRGAAKGSSLSQAGVLSTTTASTGWRTPETTGCRNSFVATLTGTNSLEKIDGAGSPESQLERPQFMAFDKDRRLYVVDRGHRQIKVVAQDGRFANLIDGSAAGGTAFVNPEGVAVALEGLSSFLYVLDDNGTNVTVQKIRLLLP